MKNRTNLIKYGLLAPIYDRLFGHVYSQVRQKIFTLLDMKPGHALLLVGVGTGQDLAFIPDDINITGIDISPAMLAIAQAKASRSTRLKLMNAEKLDFPDDYFDMVVMNLILSVVENPRAALQEAVRTVKPGGRIVIFDKFIKPGTRPGLMKRFINIFSTMIGTDITRDFEAMAKGLEVHLLRREDSIFRGAYQIILLEKKPGEKPQV